MSNIAALTNAGLIAQGANFNAEDQQLIESLSQDEVNALISVSKKLTPGFLSRNAGSTAAPAGGPAKTIGIVF